MAGSGWVEIRKLPLVRLVRQVMSRNHSYLIPLIFDETRDIALLPHVRHGGLVGKDVRALTTGRNLRSYLTLLLPLASKITWKAEYR